MLTDLFGDFSGAHVVNTRKANVLSYKRRIYRLGTSLGQIKGYIAEE